MITATGPLAPFDFVLPHDRDSESPTTWKLAPLTVREQDTAHALTSERIERADLRAETLESTIRGTPERSRTAVLRAKLVGWENFNERDEAGGLRPIQFHRERGACPLTGEQRDLVPEELLARIPLEVRRALSDELWFRARLSVDDRKN